MNIKTAIFAGGCFWCIEADFRKRPELLNIESGYTGGSPETATYEKHASGGHREAVRVTYDPAKASYGELVEYFFTIHDPTDEGGSFYDRGYSYTPAIYYADETEKEIATAIKDQVEKSCKFQNPIVTTIEPCSQFYPAEDYHQNYADKNPDHYQTYATASGRKDFLNKHHSS